MLDGNVLLRQKRDEVPEGTLSYPDRNLAVFHHYRHYEGLRLLPSVYDSKLIQQTLIMERMINPSDFYFLVLYEAVLEGNETNDDSKFSKSEQIRAIRCVKKWLEKQ